MFFADVVLQPNGIGAWLAVGLIVGWLAGKVLSEPTYGIAGDLWLGRGRGRRGFIWFLCEGRSRLLGRRPGGLFRCLLPTLCRACHCRR